MTHNPKEEHTDNPFRRLYQGDESDVHLPLPKLRNPKKSKRDGLATRQNGTVSTFETTTSRLGTFFDSFSSELQIENHHNFSHSVPMSRETSPSTSRTSQDFSRPLHHSSSLFPSPARGSKSKGPSHSHQQKQPSLPSISPPKRFAPKTDLKKLFVNEQWVPKLTVVVPFSFDHAGNDQNSANHQHDPTPTPGILISHVDREDSNLNLPPPPSFGFPILSVKSESGPLRLRPRAHSSLAEMPPSDHHHHHSILSASHPPRSQSALEGAMVSPKRLHRSLTMPSPRPSPSDLHHLHAHSHPHPYKKGREMDHSSLSSDDDTADRHKCVSRPFSGEKIEHKMETNCESKQISHLRTQDVAAERCQTTETALQKPKILTTRVDQMSSADFERINKEMIKSEIESWYKLKQMEIPSQREFAGSGLFQYFMACKRWNVPPITRIVKNLRTEELNVNGMKLGDRGLFALVECLKDNAYVIKLRLRDNMFSSQASLSIADLLESNPFITLLDISENPIGHAMTKIGQVVGKKRNVVELIAQNCGLKDKDIVNLALAICERRCSIEKLDLSKNKIGNLGFKALGDALKDATSLKHLDVSFNQMRQEGAKSIGLGLCENRSLEFVDLSWNGLGSEGGKMVGVALAEEGCMLQKICLEQCGIDSQAAIMIAQGMQANTRLADIDLKSNPIGDDGARAIFKAIGINRSITTFDLRGCNMQNDGKTMFDDANPTGSYRLNLSDVFDRHVAQKLQKLQARDVGKAWRNVRLNGAPLRVQNLKKWVVPTEGILKLDYVSGKRPPPNVKELDPEDLESLTTQLTHLNLADFDRLALLRMAASVQFYSCQQAIVILRTFTDSIPVRHSKINAFLTMFGKLVDRANIFSIMHEFNKREILEIQKSLGDLMSFNPENPTGRYKLDLAVDYERSFAAMLFDMSASEEGGTLLFKGQEDAPITDYQYGVRRAVLDGQNFRFDPRLELPADGNMEIDYLSGKPLDLKTMVRLDFDIVHQIQKALDEGEQTEDELRRLVEMRIDESVISADVGRSLLSLFKDESNKVRLAQKMFSRLLDRQNSMHALFSVASKESQVQIADVIGNINTFDSKSPYRHWRLDLSDPFDHRCARKLFALAVEMEGDNLVDLKYNNIPFRFSERTSVVELPTAGILEFDFVDGTKPQGPSFGLVSGLSTMTFLTQKPL